jgi:hypothetical protein
MYLHHTYTLLVSYEHASWDCCPLIATASYVTGSPCPLPFATDARHQIRRQRPACLHLGPSSSSLSPSYPLIASASNIPAQYSFDSHRDSPTTTLCRGGGPDEIHRRCVTVSSHPHQPIARSSYHRTPQLNMSPTELFKAMQACPCGPPCQHLTHPSISEFWFLLCVAFRSVSDAYRVQSSLVFALMYHVLRSRSFVPCTLGINSKLSMVCLFTVCFREFSAMLRCTQIQCGHFQFVKCPATCFGAASAFCCCMSAMSFQPGILFRMASSAIHQRIMIKQTRLALICGAKPRFRIVPGNSWQVWLCDSPFA